jgi:CubicO group peptidase (beta-lactamase class C family)
MSSPSEESINALHDAVVPVAIMLATVAKTLCSALFVSGRTPQEAITHSCLWSLKAQLLPDALARHVRWQLDRDTRRVDVTLELTPAVADDLIAVPYGPPSSGPWPGGEQHDDAVGRVLESAFADPQAHHAAVVVVHRGRIVGERYRDGITADTPLESWSMGKSTMGTLIGMLIGRGALQRDARAPIDAWSRPGDPRGAITLRHLLNMSSGLRCTGQDDARETWRYGLPEHFLPYAEALDVARWATDRPLEYPPDTVGRYRNCDPLALASIFRETVLKLGGDPLTWPQTELFDRLGMQGFVLETDRWGHFIISGFDYGTARDWARLGLLYLRDGVWNGERILPEGWVRFATASAPAWKHGEYGAQIWLNRINELALPADTYYFAGGGGQYVMVCPSLDLVVVRMGHTRGWEGARDKVNVMLTGITAALAGGRAA